MNSLQQFINNCHECLINGKNSNKPRDFLLKTRALKEEALVNHKVGFCPWGVTIDPSVRFFGENLEDPEKRDWQYNIWGRVIVPICDEFGDVISLATKKPESGKNPWWNLPFVKGNSLFLIDKAKKSIFLKNKVYVVEGYLDALMLYQHGLRNVVAIMGTALTTRKLALISRYCNNICFCFDVDENKSGQKASDTSILLANKYSFCDEISVIDTIPVGSDPDSYVRENGLTKYLNHERILNENDIKKIAYRKKSQESKK